MKNLSGHEEIWAHGLRVTNMTSHCKIQNGLFSSNLVVKAAMNCAVRPCKCLLKIWYVKQSDAVLQFIYDSIHGIIYIIVELEAKRKAKAKPKQNKIRSRSLAHL